MHGLGMRILSCWTLVGFGVTKPSTEGQQLEGQCLRKTTKFGTYVLSKVESGAFLTTW